MRKRSEPHTFEQRLDAEKLRLEHELSCLPDGHERDVIATRIERLKSAVEMYDFLMPKESSAASRAPGTIANASG